MERTTECDHGRPTGRRTRDLYGILDRFRSRREQHTLCGALERRNRIEPLGQLDVGLISHDLESSVRETAQLPLDGLNDARMPVTRREHTDAAGEIDIALTFHIPDFCVVGARSKQGRRGRHAPSHRGIAAGVQDLIGRGLLLIDSHFVFLSMKVCAISVFHTVPTLGRCVCECDRCRLVTNGAEDGLSCFTTP